ncbi:hypothetical protein IAQ61_004921 [Plenodomus lingam]|uniref:uncharacterized protein n=1 Tax=Leptosphaeria maculans TaxID=5022 RepID=UPI00332A48D0|nr:hypothetical protein IAQ61_004921 [Plenodomus lingam]
MSSMSSSSGSSIKSRLQYARQKLWRRGSATSTATTATIATSSATTATRSLASSGSERPPPPAPPPHHHHHHHHGLSPGGGHSLRKSISMSRLAATSDSETEFLGEGSSPDARLTRSDVLGTATATGPTKPPPTPAPPTTSPSPGHTTNNTTTFTPTTTTAATTDIGPPIIGITTPSSACTPSSSTSTSTPASSSPSSTPANTQQEQEQEQAQEQHQHQQQQQHPVCPAVTLEEPTPIHAAPQLQPTVAVAALDSRVTAPSPSSAASAASTLSPTRRRRSSSNIHSPSPSTSAASATDVVIVTPPPPPPPPPIVRRQSVANTSDARLIKTLLAPDIPHSALATGLSTTAVDDYFGPTAAAAAATVSLSAGMLHRKIWVKRPGASATLVQIREDDLVDDVRDMILKKYANSLGRCFDAPDVTLRVVPRDAQRAQDRTLGPEEEMCRTLDAYYPGGQHVTEALIIDVPQKRTPKPSPRVPLYYPYHDDATNHQTEYFPPMPVNNNTNNINNTASPAASGSSPNEARIPLPHAPHSIAVISTGQLPALPSPGSTRRGPLHSHRPKYQRTHTASPTIMAGGIPSSASTSAPRPVNRPRKDSSASETKHSATSNNPIPTPPVTADPMARQQTLQTSTPSTPRVASPILKEKRRKKRQPLEPPTLPAGLLDGSVPPINVLIVEDNIINLRVLGAFMQRLKVRWQRAMNGKEAVTKWKAGGFHLVLMDIQLPVMNGLEATKEIRRLERVNSIGVFSGGSSEPSHNRVDDQGKAQEEVVADDQLADKNMFKSPVIIVALTASSLQSDRHEALAAGCNDFLTKPVNFVWLERKVKEWGCMQALIDFDGWRKWKDFADKSDNNDSTSKLSVSYHSIAPSSKKTASGSSPTTANHPDLVNGDKDAKDKDKRAKRKSLSVLPPVLVEEGESPPLGAEGG